MKTSDIIETKSYFSKKKRETCQIAQTISGIFTEDCKAFDKRKAQYFPWKRKIVTYEVFLRKPYLTLEISISRARRLWHDSESIDYLRIFKLEELVAVALAFAPHLMQL